jgi:excisionase family DNA binding protein
MSPKPLLTLNEAASLLAVSPKTLQRLVARGDLAVIRVGSSLRFAVSDLDAFVARHRSAALTRFDAT